MKKSIYNKIRRTVLLLSLLTFLVISSSVVFIGVVRDTYENMENMVDQVHNDWRSNTRAYLKDLQIKLEKAISKGEINPYNDKEIENWITNNADILTMESSLYDFKVLSLGYSIREKNVMNIDVLLNEADLTDKHMNELFRTQFQTISNGIGEKDNATVIEEIECISREIDKDGALPYETARDILIKFVMDKDGIIFSIDNGMYDTPSIGKESYSIKNTNDEEIWIETVVIPEGLLGFDNQPPYVDGEENIHYKKLSIAISTKAESVLAPYREYTSTNSRIVTLSLCLLTIMTISSSIIIAISFKNTLKLNRLDGEKNAVETDRDSSNCGNSQFCCNDTRDE